MVLLQRKLYFPKDPEGPTFSGEVHPRGDPNCYHNQVTCDFLGRGGGAPVYAVCILLRSF